MIGNILDGRYRIVRRIGEGGMGSVYEGLDLSTQRPVAVKILNAGVQQNTEGALRFEREANVIASLATPHVVELLANGRDEALGQLYMVMELLKGIDVQQLLSRSRVLPVDVALKIAAQTALGLAAAHEASVIHRDIKPANLFLARQPSGEILIKILDFGVAKITPSILPPAALSALTRPGYVLGSPLYMSPEQAHGSREVDHRSDIWSVGVVLYEMLSGSAPFAHVEGCADLIVNICKVPAPSLRNVAPWVSEELAQVVHRALAIELGERFQSMTELFRTLVTLLPEGPALNESDLKRVGPERKVVFAPRMPDGSLAPPSSRNDVTVSSSQTQLSTAASNRNPTSQRLEPGAQRGRLLFALSLTAALGTLMGVAVSRRTTPAETSRAHAGAASHEAPERRIVRLTLPSAAVVSVDGKPGQPHEGTLVLEGPIDSSHRVVLSEGTRRETFDVRITRTGAEPPSLAFRAAGPENPARAAAPQPTSTR